MDIGKETLTVSEAMTFEKYFSCDESIPLDERYLYFQMLRQTKDFMDSKHTISDEDSTRFEMVLMNLHKEGNDITFNGAISNGVENRWVDGIIKQNGKRHYILTHVFRLHQSVPESIKEYYVYDTYKRIQDRLYQETIYDESLEYRKQNPGLTSYKKRIEEFDMESFYKFREHVGKTYRV